MSQQGEGPWHISSPRALSPLSEITDLCASYRWRRCSEGGGRGGGREGVRGRREGVRGRREEGSEGKEGGSEEREREGDGGRE